MWDSEDPRSGSCDFYSTLYQLSEWCNNIYVISKSEHFGIHFHIFINRCFEQWHHGLEFKIWDSEIHTKIIPFLKAYKSIMVTACKRQGYAMFWHFEWLRVVYLAEMKWMSTSLGKMPKWHSWTQHSQLNSRKRKITTLLYKYCHKLWMDMPYLVLYVLHTNLPQNSKCRLSLGTREAIDLK